MRRIVQPSRVVFVERNRERSFFLILVAFVPLVMAQTAWDRRDADSTALPFTGSWLAGAGGLAAGALLLLLRQRAFVVDRAAGSLRILGLRFLKRTVRSLPLKHVAVRLDRATVDLASRAPYVRTTSSIWIELSGREEVLFLDDVRGREGEHLARCLANDLGCRLHVNDVSEWGYGKSFRRRVSS